MQPHIINRDNNRNSNRNSNRDSNRNNEQIFDNAQTPPSFANIVNDSHAVSEPVEMKNVLNNLVPKNQQTIMLQSLVDTNENNIANAIVDGSITQLPSQIPTQPKPMGPANGSINGLVQTMSEKLVVRTNNKAQQTPPSVWSMKKSTQSVAVSVVPSNNYPHNEMNAAKQNILGSNNSSSCSNNNNIPIVPKVDEQQQSSKVNATASTIAISENKSIQSSQDVTTTQQSSEVQTVPVSDMQSEEPSMYANNNIAR